MARKTGELKKRCWLAKQRLKMGYWESVREGKSGENPDAVQSAVQTAFAARMVREAEVAASANAPSLRDESMYRKVCEILDSPEVALNPIGQLIERDIYDGLDAANKQRYILELSEKFRELKDRYYRERTGT